MKEQKGLKKVGGEEFDKADRMGRIGNRPYWVLNLSIGIRALHQIGAAVFITAYLLDEIGSPPPVFLGLVFISGIALVFAEWLRHRQLLREFSGVITLVKLLLIGCAYHGFLPTTPTMVAAFLLASIGAHAPKLIRHRLLF